MPLTSPVSTDAQKKLCKHLKRESKFNPRIWIELPVFNATA